MSWEHNYNEGRLALLCRDYIQAENHFHKALLLLRSSSYKHLFIPKVQTLLAETLFQSKLYDEAGDLCLASEQQFAINPVQDAYSRGVNNYLLAEIHHSRGSDQKAQKYFRLAAPFLEAVLHEDHIYRRRTAKQLGSNSKPSLHAEPASPWDLPDDSTPAETEKIAAWRQRSADDMYEWISSARTSYEENTEASLLQAYKDLNYALINCSWIAGHICPDYELIISMLAEISVAICCDDMAIRLCHAAVSVNAAMFGEQSEITAKSKGLLASAYLRLGQFQVAEEIFNSAFSTLKAIGATAQYLMPDALKSHEQLRSYRRSLMQADQAILEAGKHYKYREHKKAARVLESAQQEMLKVFPESSPTIFPLLTSLGTVYHNAGLLPELKQIRVRIALVERTGQEQARKNDLFRQQHPLALIRFDEAA